MEGRSDCLNFRIEFKVLVEFLQKDGALGIWV